MSEDKYSEAASNGTKGLVSTLTNKLTGFKANVTITRADVKKTLLEAALLISSTTPANITTHEGAKEEANRQNIF